MRFNTGALIGADASVVKLMQMINRLPLSPWTPSLQSNGKTNHQRSLPHAGAEIQS
jgi:hypothetical protein